LSLTVGQAHFMGNLRLESIFEASSCEPNRTCQALRQAATSGEQSLDQWNRSRSQQCNMGWFVERKLNHLIKYLVHIYQQNCRVNLWLEVKKRRFLA
jgi:hypothetical protein